MISPISNYSIINSINALNENASKISKAFSVNTGDYSSLNYNDDALVNDIVSFKMSENEIKTMAKVIKIEDEVEKNLIDIIA